MRKSRLKDRFVTDFNWKDVDLAPKVEKHEDMILQGFCMVGITPMHSKCCYYAKGLRTNPDYPEGVFFEIGGDENFWDAAEIFKDPKIQVRAFWPRKIELIGDDRPVENS